MVRSVLVTFGLAAVALAIAKANSWDVTVAIDGLWHLLSVASDLALQIWHKVATIASSAAVSSAVPSPAAS